MNISNNNKNKIRKKLDNATWHKYLRQLSLCTMESDLLDKLCY